MIKLSETRDKDGNIVSSKIDQFVAERNDEVGDQAELERVIRSMAGTSKEAPEASSRDDCDD